MQKQLTFIATLILICAAGHLLAAPVTMEATDDTYIQADSDTGDGNNYGTGTSLDVAYGPDPRHKTWVKFSLAGLTPDPMQSATLSFQITGAGGDGSGTPLQVYALDTGFTGTTDWSETGVAWDGVLPDPPANGDYNGFTSDATLIDGTPHIWVAYSSSFPITQNVTIPTLGDYLQDDETVTFMLRVYSDSFTANGRWLTVPSSEHGSLTGPQLTFEQIPEPATALLLGLFGVAAATGRRPGRS